MALATNNAFFKFAVSFEFGDSVRLRLYTKIAQLLENGVSLDTALSQIHKIATRKGGALPKLIQRWRNDVAEGINFGVCLAPYVPSIEAILLESGSNSGKLIAALRNAAEAIENQGKVKKAIINAGAYPGVLTLMLIATLVLSSYKVIPTFEEMVPLEKWQGVSYGVAISATFIREQGLFLLGLLAAFIFTISYSLPNWTGRARKYFDRVAPWSLYKMLQGSAFLLSIASLMSAGVKLDELSLAKIGRQSQPYLKQRIKGIQKYIAAGENLGDALYKSGYEFPDSEIIGDLQIYAALRGFDQNLIRVTRVWVDGLIERVNAAMQVVNFVILILITVVIACLIMSFYSVFQQIQTQS